MAKWTEKDVVERVNQTIDKVLGGGKESGALSGIKNVLQIMRGKKGK